MERVKRNIVTIHILLAAILMLLTTCKRDERDNPWDKFAAINPDTWAPKAVQTSNIDITKHEVAWTYEGDNRIEGFRIDRKEGNSEWEIGVFTAEKDDRSWIDTNVIPDTTLTYTYKVYAIAGDNKSSNIIASIDVEFPAPTSIDIEKISDVSYKLSWKDNSNGEQGFKIDRRTDGSEWQIAHGTVEANQTAYIDTNVFVSKSVLRVEYRVYAYHGDFTTVKPTKSTEAALTPPSDLSISASSITSVTLVWQYNKTTHQGFKVDRKAGNNDWQEAFATIGETQTTYSDNTVDFTTNNRYTYKVYAYYSDYNSEKAEVFIALPTVTTTETSAISATTATSGGTVSDAESSAVTARGVVWSTSQNPTVETNEGITFNSTGTGTFTSNLSDLTPGTTYYLRAYATNSIGTSYGVEQTFTTLDGIIVLTTAEVTAITTTSATSGGNVTDDGGAAVTVRGVVWSTSQNPTIDNNEDIISSGIGTGEFSSELSNLEFSTTYYARAYATNSVGTQYGNQVSFTTRNPDGPGGTITDADGNTYNTIWINGRQWMKENLKTTKYNNGTNIPNVTDNGTWADLSTPAYCWYNNDQANYGNTYGALYNWYAVNTGNLCPTGWHVPTDSEWYAMENYVDPTINDPNATGWRGTDGGTKLKATSGWNSGGYGTDEYGFSALPGGNRNYYDGGFYSVGSSGFWWSSTEGDATNAWGRYVRYDYGGVSRYNFNKRYGFSVRCVRD